MADRKPFACRDCGTPITLISVPGRDKDYTMAFLVPPATIERDDRGWVKAVRLVVHDCPNRQKGKRTETAPTPSAPLSRPATADEEVPF